ncbi:MAG: glutamate 5-kinase [Pseudomonadota bacterium]|nr:glutamate 5-kinase [Pseudomonadota bacterium]MEC8262515.1 glutamate 5-kinase [Pseudomonadota bacterium]
MVAVNSAGNTAAAAVDSASTIIIKIGSSLLVEDSHGAVNSAWLADVASDIAMLRKAGKNVVVVSSGAIALGRRELGIDGRELALEEKQAAAATGQVTLAHAWREALAAHGIGVAQILLSPEDTETRRRHLNARATMGALLELGAVPVVNENDTVATAEIRFGDNDRLAARVAAMISADLLVLLSDIDGLYSANPRKSADAVHVPQVDSLNDEVMAMAGSANAAYASGGMVTKLEAARIAMNAGCGMIICDGQGTRPLSAVMGGARHTLFRAEHSPLTARKRWIGGSLAPRGGLRVDDGALRAIRQGRSLLPAGVTSVAGNFERGDLIAIEDAAGHVIGHGLSAYSAADARVILGHKSREIEGLLGYRGRDEVVHADNLVMLEQSG